MKSVNKMNEQQAAVYIGLHHKEISKEVEGLSAHNNFAGIIQAVLNLTKSLLEKRKLTKVIQLIKNIGRLYRRANENITNLIENIFIFSLTRISRRCSAKEWQLLYSEVPKPFKTVYLMQIDCLNKKR